jgi:hypothetical protein
MEDEVLVPVKQSIQFYVECPRFKDALFKVSFAQCQECKHFVRHSLESDDIVCSWKDCMKRSFFEKQKEKWDKP